MNLAVQHSEALSKIIVQAMLDFNAIADLDWNEKPLPEKWSRKEILGHLVDSANNNLRRFIVGQYEQGAKIVYDQNQWIVLQDYQESAIEDIKLLWKLLNEQIVRVLQKFPETKLQNTCDTGKGEILLRPLSYLIEDYLTHLNYHLAQLKA